MEQLHATYQALKAATDHLYNEAEAKYVSPVKAHLDAALKAMEDALGITKARIMGERRKRIEDTPPPPQLPVEPSKVAMSPGDIAAQVNDTANNKV